MERQNKYSERVKKRELLARLGLATALVAGVSFAIGILLLLVGHKSPSQLDGLIGVSQYGISFGIIFAVVFGRLGWSENKFIDFFLNQMSVALTAFGFITIIIGDINYQASLTWVGSFCAGIGVLLALLGIWCQTEPFSE